MTLVIHRRTSSPARRPRLLLVGGEGRWARPLLKLVASFGFDPEWSETDPDPHAMDASDVVVAASPRAAERLLAARGASATPVVVITGSLLGLSTPVCGPASRALRWPITREALAQALGSADDTPRAA